MEMPRDSYCEFIQANPDVQRTPALDSMVNQLPYEIKLKVISNVYRNNCKMILDALKNNNMWVFRSLDIYPIPKEVVYVLYSGAWLKNCSIEESKQKYGYICFLVEISTKKGFDLLTNDLLNELKQLSAGDTYLQNGLIQLSAANGNLNLFKRLYELGVDCDFIFNKAVENNHFHIVKFIIENNIEDIEIEHNSGINPMDLAAENGNLEMFKYLEVHNIGECSKHAMDFAAKNGHIEMVKYLNENRNEGCSEYAMNFAIQNDNLEMIEYLNTHRTEGCDYNKVIEYILHKCTHETVRYLYDHCPAFYDDDVVRFQYNNLNYHEYFQSAQYKRKMTAQLHAAIYNELIMRACTPARLFQWNEGAAEQFPEEYAQECSRYK
jgi:hypothetical protein